MEEKRTGFRLRLNLFDALVLIAALLVGGYLAWNALKPADNAGETPTASVVRYTVRFQKMLQGTWRAESTSPLPLRDTRMCWSP